MNCNHVQGQGSTLRTAFTGKVRAEGDAYYGPYWFCWCEACHRETDMTMTAGEYIARAIAGWWKGRR